MNEENLINYSFKNETTCYYLQHFKVRLSRGKTECLTGKYWMDIKPIYQQCFEGTVTAAANTE
jgi:hypothetical protein